MAASKKRNGNDGERKSKKAPGKVATTTPEAGNGSSRGDSAAVAQLPATTTTLSQAIRQVRPMAREAFEESRHQSQQRVQDFESSIRAQPIRSLLMAVGVGFLIGLIWR
jgi:ElaB/YqjD/DUF883 family membrane-anchored ribosome-binding protein